MASLGLCLGTLTLPHCGKAQRLSRTLSSPRLSCCQRQHLVVDLHIYQAQPPACGAALASSGPQLLCAGPEEIHLRFFLSDSGTLLLTADFGPPAKQHGRFHRLRRFLMENVTQTAR